MNKARRAELDKVLKILNAMDIEDMITTIDSAATDERDGFENLSEGLQASANGQAMEAAADALDEAKESLEEMQTNLENAIAKIEEARDG